MLPHGLCVLVWTPSNAEYCQVTPSVENESPMLLPSAAGGCCSASYTAK